MNEPLSKKESLSFDSKTKIINHSKSMSIEILRNICQQLSIHLIDLLEFNHNSLASFENTIQLNHYFQTNESLIINKNENFLLQFHLYSKYSLQKFDLSKQEWKSINDSLDSDRYILVTLPNFSYRYFLNESSNYTMNYLCYNNNDNQVEKRTYFLSLKQNRVLRYFTFFYLYVMQGVPAGFSSTALANRLTGKRK